MNADLLGQASNLFQTYVVPLGWKMVGAIAVWLVGGWIIRIIRAAIGRAMSVQKVDATLARYIEAGANVMLKLLLFVAVLSVLGIETTSFAALLAALGIAIGAAWGGLLSNFAAGMFLMVLRPFKVGDMISGGGVTGDVREIGLLVTTVDTADNIRVYVGNNKLFSDSIQNFTANPYRRVDLKAQIAHGVNPYDAIKRLAERVAKIANVVADPSPSVEVLDFNAMGTVIAVRPYCNNAHYWQVYFDTNKAIVDVCSEAQYATPETRHLFRQANN
ncbi:MAG: mechanosensitive ion channel family protein [Burkholderiales bacterium]